MELGNSLELGLKIECGFETLIADFLRKSVLFKGRKLWESGHVSGLEEEYRPDSPEEDFHNSNSRGFSIIRGRVLPQTSVSNEPYSVVLKVDNSRRVLQTYCQCQAGNSQCKHIAALVIAVNEEEPTTKTSFKRTWGIPTNTAQKYKKGHKIAQLFPPKILCPEVLKHPPLEHLGSVPGNSALTLMLKTEAIEDNLRISKTVLEDVLGKVVLTQEQEELQAMCSTVLKFQENETPLHFRTVVNLQNGKMSIQNARQEMDPNIAAFYNRNVCCTPEEALQICLKTIKQSECEEWFAERKLRVSATAASRIKTRCGNYEALVDQLLNAGNKNRVSTAAMRHGLKTEPEARTEFSKLHGVKVIQTGLIIYARQPWMCCSPDGLFFVDSELVLLEVKCPFSFVAKRMVNISESLSEVPYLYFENGELHLKKTHVYYTQIQFSLYVTKASHCMLFVYTKLENISVRVTRDPVFLLEYVAKLENFYYQYYLPELYRRIPVMK